MFFYLSRMLFLTNGTGKSEMSRNPKTQTLKVLPYIWHDKNNPEKGTFKSQYKYLMNISLLESCDLNSNSNSLPNAAIYGYDKKYPEKSTLVEI